MTPDGVSDELLEAVEEEFPASPEFGTVATFLCEQLLEKRQGKVVLAVNLGECGQVGDRASGEFVHPQTGQQATMPMRLSETGPHWTDQANGQEGWYAWLEATTDADQAVLDAMYSQSTDLLYAVFQFGSKDAEGRDHGVGDGITAPNRLLLAVCDSEQQAKQTAERMRDKLAAKRAQTSGDEKTSPLIGLDRYRPLDYVASRNRDRCSIAKRYAQLCYDNLEQAAERANWLGCV